MSKRKNFTVAIPSRLEKRSGGSVIITNPTGRYAVESTTGVSRRLPTGWLTPTPYSFHRSAARLGTGTFNLSEIWNGQKYEYDDSYGNILRHNSAESVYTCRDRVYAPQGVPQAMIDQALIKARLKMKRGDLNLGVAFAERNKTAQLLGDTASRLAKAYRALRKGDLKRVGRELGIAKPNLRQPTIPRKWLELQYGWKPLLSDVYGSVDALARRHAHDWRVTGIGSVREAIDVRDRQYPYGDADPKALVTAGIGSATGYRGCYVRIDAVPENDLLLALASLGVTNPLLIAWELVPFSFVVDWALPIGAYLESLDAMLGYKDTYCTISTMEKFEAEYRLFPPENRWGGYTAKRSGSGHWDYVALNRSVSLTVPLPTMPRLKDPTSLNRMANGLSLLAAVFTGRR